MTQHLVEIGPRSTRRLCCGTVNVVDPEAEQAAFESIDDPYALVDDRPVAVAELWRNLLSSIDCGTSAAVTVVYPSWWSPKRIAVIDHAARVLRGPVEMRPRTWLLNRAACSPERPAVVEIVDDVVVVTTVDVTVVSRAGVADDDAEAVAVVIRAIASDVDTVVIDAPPAVRSAALLAMSIAKRLTSTRGISVVIANELCLRKLVKVRESTARGFEPVRPPTRRRWIAAILLTGGFVGVATGRHLAPPRQGDRVPTTFLVEGRMGLEVPAQWSVRRIVTGPGSARLQITSPTDPEVAVHATQSRVALSGLEATAGFLESAIDAAPRGVFVDFDPAGRAAGHPAATYREIRADHDIRWAVWVDKAVRISIGCQSRRGRADLVEHACDLAVRSARALE